jgi:hypothetical protein
MPHMLLLLLLLVHPAAAAAAAAAASAADLTLSCCLQVTTPAPQHLEVSTNHAARSGYATGIAAAATSASVGIAAAASAFVADAARPCPVQHLLAACFRCLSLFLPSQLAARC